MTRLDLIDPPSPGEPDPHNVAELYRQAAQRRGSVLDLYRVVANSPRGLGAYLTLSAFIRDGTSLEPRLRELAIVATGAALGVEYEMAHHIPLARSAGVSENQLAILQTRGAPMGEHFDSVEAAVVEYAYQVAADRTVSDSCFGALRRFLSDEQVMDLILTVAFYHLCAAVIIPLQLPPEEPR